MKLEIVYLKEMLEELENNESFMSELRLNRNLPEEEKKLGHIFIMDDAKLIEFSFKKNESNTFYNIFNLRITYAGYQFLEATRNKTIWSKIKKLSAPLAIESAKVLVVEGIKAIVDNNLKLH